MKKSRLNKRQAIAIKNDQQLAQELGMTILRHYPGHEWRVEADIRQGMCHILNMSLSGNFGYTLNLTGHTVLSRQKAVIKGCGEVLERFNVARGQAKRYEVNELKTDFAGNNIHD